MRAWIIGCVTLAACNGLQPIEAVDLEELSETERARVELGRALFFDPGLSGSGDVSCATCHDPAVYGTDGTATSVGVDGAVGRRNSPSVLNAALKRWQFWDARAESLEEQALGPLYAEDEMGQTRQGLLAHARTVYADAFAAAFPAEPGPEEHQVARALAAYQRTLAAPSRLDRFLLGDASALDRREERGLRLFEQNCVFCHSGAGVGGSKLRELGTDRPWPSDRRDDLGRAEVTGRERDEMVFVVPSLRNVAETAPYFHDGSVETLDEAVRLMARHQLGTTLPETDVDDIVAFLGALTAEELPEWAYAP